MTPQAEKQAIVAGLFENWNAARAALEDLQAIAFSGDQIGVAFRELTEHAQTNAGAAMTKEAASSAVGGGLLGGLAGFLVGIGAVAIPGIGPVIAGGVLATSLSVTAGTTVAGAGMGAAMGGLFGALVGLEVPEADARWLESGMRGGQILVVVQAGGRSAEALQILLRHGAEIPGGPVSTGVESGTTLL